MAEIDPSCKEWEDRVDRNAIDFVETLSTSDAMQLLGNLG